MLMLITGPSTQYRITALRTVIKQLQTNSRFTTHVENHMLAKKITQMHSLQEI